MWEGLKAKVLSAVPHIILRTGHAAQDDENVE